MPHCHAIPKLGYLKKDSCIAIRGFKVSYYNLTIAQGYYGSRTQEEKTETHIIEQLRRQMDIKAMDA